MAAGGAVVSGDVVFPDLAPTFRADIELYDADGHRVHHLYAAAKLAGINTHRVRCGGRCAVCVRRLRGVGDD